MLIRMDCISFSSTFFQFFTVCGVWAISKASSCNTLTEAVLQSRYPKLQFATLCYKHALSNLL